MNTCAANGPISTFLLLIPALAPYAQVPAVASPKFQRYSRSWNGVVVAVDVVPEASKNTDNGATPDIRDGTTDSVIVVPPVEFWVNATVTLLAADIVVEQVVPVPVQSPLQPEKVKPLLVVAVSVTFVPGLKFAEQLEPQLIPVGNEVAVPPPLLAIFSV